MKLRTLAILTTFALVAVLAAPTPPASAGAPAPCDDISAALIAGQNTEIGTVSVWTTSSALIVRYDVTAPGWCLERTHVYAGKEAPSKSAPGSFPFHSGDLGCATTYTETIFFSDVDFDGDDCLYVAAHADTKSSNCGQVGSPVEAVADLCASLPDTVTMALGQWSDSYFRVTISNGGVLDGTYAGWCVDTDRNIGYSTYNGVTPVCYGDPGFVDLFEYPENVDLVAWILNQDIVGGTAGDGAPYTFGDVQRAIWTLIEDNLSGGGLGPWSQAHVDEIVDAAYLNGNGFEPDCGDLVPVALNSVDASGTIFRQIILIGVPLVCPPECGTETAWAFSLTTDNRQWWKKKKATGWGVYFEFNCCN